ncbi:MAG: response regulator [Minwuia thermotolerans]|nr:MAG: response regulator [Minwuia thermotolerans]
MPRVIWAEDDPVDRILFERAILKSGAGLEPTFVDDGQEMLDLLNGRGWYLGQGKCEDVDLLVLDLNMPGMDGRRLLAQLQKSEDFRRIPSIVMTTSQARGDVLSCYDLGANSYITKPRSFDDLVQVIRNMDSYWSTTCMLPAA